MSNTKKVYVFTEDCSEETWMLLLSDEQAAIIYWLKSLGYDFRLEKLDKSPYEITADIWNH